MTRESAALREKRLELKELEDGKAYTDPALYDVLHQALLDDVAELEAEGAAAPIHSQEVSHETSPGKAGAPGPPPATKAPVPATKSPVPATKPVSKESPMPKTAVNSPNPGERIAHLVGRIRTAAKKGEKLYWAQQEIRKVCAAHGLEVPPEAAKVHGGKSQGKHQAQTKEAKPVPSTPEPPQDEACRQHSEGLDRPMEIAIDLGRAIERHVSAPAKLDDIRTHLRGIRRQVWSLLADLENLTPEQLQALQGDMAFLDAAVHTALQMVERVEVVA